MGLVGGYFLFPLWPVTILVLVVSSVTDLYGKKKKIYNLVTLPAAVLGLAYHAAGNDFWYGLTGFAAGFLMLWPVYWMGGTKAGDVKLLAAFGALMGNHAALTVGLFASFLFLAYALVFYLLRGELLQWFSNTLQNARYLALRQLDGEKVSSNEIVGGEHSVPFAPFIGAGALIYYILGVIH